MVKRLVVGILILTCTGSGIAQQNGAGNEPKSATLAETKEPLVMLTGKDQERNRRSELVQRVKQTLVELGAAEITDAPQNDSTPLGRWRWVMLNEVEWVTMTRIYVTKAPLAFGNLQQRVTYVRASRAASISVLELRRLLAHELGHLVCACADQTRADEAADSILNATTRAASRPATRTLREP